MVFESVFKYIIFINLEIFHNTLRAAPKNRYNSIDVLKEELEELLKYYFRGLIDGDGCIHKDGKISIYSNYDYETKGDLNVELMYNNKNI